MIIKFITTVPLMCSTRSGVFFLLFFFAVGSRAQGIVDIAPQVSEQVSLGAFKNGWAMVREGRDEYYIDTSGEKLRIQNPNDVMRGTAYAIDEYTKERQDNPNLLPRNIILFEKNGLWGVVDPKGEVLIPAEYSAIDIQYRQFWELHQGNRKTYYLPDGSMLPLFEDIGYLNGEYFDVKQDNAWHIYRKSAARIITKTPYEGFDYCGGCGSASPYVYAKKNGKWGIIDWEENVLVPFEYDHEHRSMRSDNWVASFSRNGESVVVHIPTQQEFNTDDEATELISGMLVTTKDGKYGAYRSDGQLAVPFEYDHIEAPNQNYYLGYYGSYLIVEKNQQKGVVRSDGELVLPVEHSEVMVYDDYFVVTRDGQTSLLAAGETKPLIQVEHGEITHVNDYFYSSGSDGLAIFRVKQQAYFGLYFAGSGVFLEPEFYDVSILNNDCFEDGRIIVGDKQGQKTLLSLSGESVLPFEVESFEVFDRLEKSLLAINVRGKWGLYDVLQQKVIVPPQYDRYFRVLDNQTARFIRATIEEEGQPDRYVLYDTSGQQVIDKVFSTIESIDDRYYLIGMGDTEVTEYAIFNTDTHTLELLEYSFAGLSGSPGLLVVSDDRITGKLYDITKGETLQRNYRIFLFSGALTEGDEFLSVPDDVWSLSPFSDGLARVDAWDGTGYIDEYERVVIEPKYERVQLIGENHAVVSETGDYGGGQLPYVTDRSGNRVFPEEYYVDDVIFYNHDDYDLEGVIILVKNKEDANRYFSYSQYFGLGELHTGKLLTEAKYRQIIPLRNFPYMILEEEVTDETTRTTVRKYGLATKRGDILIEPQFDDIHYDDFLPPGDADKNAAGDIFPLLVSEGGKWKYVNADGSYLPIVGDYAHRY